MQARRFPNRPLRGHSLKGTAVSNGSAPPPPTLVITGASTGIGRAITLGMAAQAGRRVRAPGRATDPAHRGHNPDEWLAAAGHRRGWTVFAGVRTVAAGEALAAAAAAVAPPGSVRPLQLEVRDDGAVRAAAKAVASYVGDSGLQGLVNNAGKVVVVPVEVFPLDGENSFKDVMDVNLMGPVRCTQAFLPLLRRGRQRGRIVMISSVAGSVSLPMFGAYVASKHALEGLSDALALEVAPQGISVSVVTPGPIATPLWGRAREASDAQLLALDGEAAEVYGRVVQRVRELVAQSEAGAIPEAVVVAAVHHALTAAWPRTRYIPGVGPKVLLLLERLLPAGAFHAVSRALLGW